ncbi:MAG TPA: hypothetical protein VNN79_08820 [Actinomycetota bacterium]|nr:hypothetical protein [Actinomycetota bacterium]
MTRIHGASPWTRTAIADLSADELEAIDAILPEGTWVTLGAGRSPGNWRVFLMRENGTRYPDVVQRVEGVHNIPNGVRTAVTRWLAEQDVEEDETLGDTNREGQPEFNGSFR